MGRSLSLRAAQWIATLRRRERAIAPALLVVACLSSSGLLVRHLGTLAGGGDAPIYEYTGYYLRENLTFGLWPTLALEGNGVFYPYGTNSVFQQWGLERDYLYAALNHLFGPGPWLPLYYVVSILISGLGGYALARRDLGCWRAFLVGLAPAVLNFHATFFCWEQFGYCVLHWAVLGFLLDFLIVRRVVRRDSPTRGLIIGRLTVLVLSLGLDSTYATSYGLLSATVSSLFVVCILSTRRLRRSVAASKPLAMRNRPSAPVIIALLAVTALATWLYLPVLIQIGRAARSFGATVRNSGSWWVSPARLAVPILPWLNPLNPKVGALFDDSAGLGPAGSPGWTLLVLAALGVWHGRGSRLAFVPIATVFALCLAYHPPAFATLNVFPWFAFFRVGSRSTNFYPIILALFATGMNWNVHRFSHRLGLVALVALGVVETATAYSFSLKHPRKAMSAWDQEYMGRIRNQPGEAVLDWPFCAMGGNGVGAGVVCPEDVGTFAIFSLRRFHEKKVMGQYFGRLHPTQIRSYVDAGWPRLLAKSSRDASPSSSDCFSPVEWSFFERFYELNDFAGINLWTDHLSPACVVAFRRRFGPPSASATLVDFGQVDFLPKPAALRKRVDQSAGIRLKLDAPE